MYQMPVSIHVLFVEGDDFVMILIDLMSTATIVVLVCILTVYYYIVHPLYVCHKSRIPGPKLYALTKWRLALDDWQGSRTRTINKLHQHYGPVIRIGPDEIHFNSISALRTIYGAGSGFERTTFYRMFDVYGTQNLFTFHSSKQHANRKKLLANAYSKSSMLQPSSARMIEGKVKLFLDYISDLKGSPDEIFTSLHYFSIDSITHFVYGSRFGGTQAVTGNSVDRRLLGDILDPTRRKLSWFAVHMPQLTKWLYTRTKMVEKLVKPFLPMQKPATYTGIRLRALKAWNDFKAAAGTDHPVVEKTIMSLLWKHHVSQKEGGLQDMEIASECADHLLAGIDTTADTMMFLVWALSRPENLVYQKKVIAEVCAMSQESLGAENVPTVEASDKLTYVNAVIKETLRLYAPLPATEPRILNTDTVIDGFLVPAGTVVGMSPFSLHRNADVFPEPLKFDPERWLRPDSDLKEMNKWFWAFSSGARMCIGMHLAMAEMTTLVAGIYRTYQSSLAKPSVGYAPAITSRFEMFFDETIGKIKEHECWINFTRHE